MTDNVDITVTCGYCGSYMKRGRLLAVVMHYYGTAHPTSHIRYECPRCDLAVVVEGS